MRWMWWKKIFTAYFLHLFAVNAVNYFFSPRSRWRLIIFFHRLMRWIIYFHRFLSSGELFFFTARCGEKKIIDRIKRWKRRIHRHRECGEKKIIHRDSPHSPQKDVRNTRWKLFFFTAFHRISYENSPPNLDPGFNRT